MNTDSLPFEIAETAHALRREFDRRAAPLGVTRAQWRTLAWIARVPGMRQVELADHLDIEPITVCRILDRLEESRLVERRRDPADRRAWQLFLTAKAEPMVAELRAIAANLAADAFDGLSGQQCDAVRLALSTVRSNLSHLAEQSLTA